MMTSHRIIGAAAALAFFIACAPPVTPGPTTGPAPTVGGGQQPAPATPAPSATATATIVNLVGNRVGTATFTETHSGLLITGTVNGLGLGAHGMHIHAVGQCTAPFETAGGHHNPGSRKHGFRNPDGAHAGDLPNIVTPAAGTHTFELLVPELALRGRNGLLDADGASIVVHGSRDDYLTDPSGGSGGRIACGVIRGT